jgi:hypothetical protein
MKVLFGNSQRQHVKVDLLSAYLDNQVSAAERDRIERHLSSCETCRREYDTLRQTVMFLRAMPQVRVPRAFTLSEAQAGIRRPSARPGWPVGVLRGVGAIAAVLLVAVVATTLLRHPAWTPGRTVARAPKAVPPPTAAPAAAPRAAASAVSLEKQALPAPSEAAAPIAAPEVTIETAMEAPAAPAQPTEAPPPSPEAFAAPATEPATSAPAPTPEPDLMAESKAMVATEVPPPAQPAPAAETAAVAVPGRGGGGGVGAAAAGPAAVEAEGPAVEPPPPVSPASTVLPDAAGVVYLDQGSLWTLDRQSGERQLLRVPDAGSPLISDDRAWIVYRSQQADSVQFWAVPWSGGQPQVVIDERSLPTRSLPQGYDGRRIQNVAWIPGQHVLAVVTLAIPSDANRPPEYELWNVNVDSGKIEYVTQMGQTDRPFYAPGGRRFALPRVEGPDGGLWLFNADGSGGRAALALPQGVGGSASDWQVRWMPDASALWLAIPEPPAGTALYRVPVNGKAQLATRIEALDAYWSPDGSRLAYTSAVSDSLDTRELYVANADGSDPSLYATPRYWAFLGWSPDGGHFLYQDNQQVYLGTPGQPPQVLGNFLSIFDPQWISADQFLHFLDQNASWVLVSRWLDGRTASLVTLPRDAAYDIVPR